MQLKSLNNFYDHRRRAKNADKQSIAKKEIHEGIQCRCGGSRSLARA
jgi:hypothetical protein